LFSRFTPSKTAFGILSPLAPECPSQPAAYCPVYESTSLDVCGEHMANHVTVFRPEFADGHKSPAVLRSAVFHSGYLGFSIA
jgi:hypothetical protein